MADCECGARLAHFKNPDRWECSDPGKHAAYLREQRQHSGGWPKGKPRGPRGGKK